MSGSWSPHPVHHRRDDAARLYLAEMLDGAQVPPGLAYMDMATLSGLGGQERGIAAFDELLRRAATGWPGCVSGATATSMCRT